MHKGILQLCQILIRAMLTRSCETDTVPEHLKESVLALSRSVKNLGPFMLPSVNYDLQTLQVMRSVLRSGSNCVDVGCHQGSILGQMLKLSPGGHHFGFEPLPDIHRRLLMLACLCPNVTILDYALSDINGTSSFQHVVTNPAYSGLRQRKYDAPNERLEEIKVRTARMDSVIPPTVPIDFIKIDVEGAEYLVLQGAADIIRKNRPVIVFEFGLGAADWYGVQPNQMYDLLVEDYRLKLFFMDEWLRDSQCAPLSKAEFSKQFRSGGHYYFLAHP